MSGTGISRNIPAARRHLLLDRMSDLSKWPGYREIRAQTIKGSTRVTYEGQGGYICLRLGPEEDFEQRLIAIDRLIEHDIQFARIHASRIAERIACDYDSGTDTEVENDMPPPLWSWIVPETLQRAFCGQAVSALKEWIEHALALPGTGESGRIGNADYAIRTGDPGSFRKTIVELFSASNAKAHLSWGTSRNYLKLRSGILPQSVLAALPGKPISHAIAHPFVHPETVVQSVNIDKGDIVINLWRNRSILAAPPLCGMEEVCEAYKAGEKSWE